MTDKGWRALFIHGVGQETADFAVQSAEWLGAAVPGITPAYVHWAPLADRVESGMLADIKAHGSKGDPSQRLTIFTLADAIYYQGSPELQAAVFALFDEAYARVCRPGEQITIFGHSLGCLIATDWLRARPRVLDVRLFTLASNIGLFTLGRKFVPVPQLVHGRWYNVFDPDDCLGFPMGGMSVPAKDVPVQVGGIEGMTGLAHVRYWDSHHLWSHTIPELLRAQ